MCRVQILILLLALVQICMPVYGYTFEDNRIDAHDIHDVAVATTRAPETVIHSRRMFALCPPQFYRIGSECYLISGERKNWLEAHFYCKEKNAKLAEPQKNANRKIREYMLRHFPSHTINEPIWIGAIYDWNLNVWQWGISGKNLKYNAFDPINNNGRNLENHCALYNPLTNYSWSARLCTEKQRFICQHKMPKVSGRNRHKVYERWNATYPHQYANEVILEVISRKNGNGKRINRRLRAQDSGEDFKMPNGHNNRHITELGNDHSKRSRLHHKSTTMNSAAAIISTTTISPNHSPSENEVLRPRTSGRKNPRGRTDYDRRLHWQRQKERRLNRRRRLHMSTTSTTADPSTTTTTTTTTTTIEPSTTTTLRAENYEMRRQVVGEPPQTQTDNLGLELIDEEENKKLQMYYLNKRKEAELRELEEREYEKQKREKAEREEAEREEKQRQLKSDYEESIKRAQAEQEKLRERELKMKEMRDEENRRHLEELENERLALERAEAEREELRRQQESLENARRLETKERERLQREEEMRLEQERKTAEKMRRLKEEESRHEAEEAAAAEEERLIQQKAAQREKMLMEAESQPETTTINRNLADITKSSRWMAADELAKTAEQNKRRKYAERIMKLSPELQKQWLVERRRRRLNGRSKPSTQ